MFKGERDCTASIRVPQENCDLYQGVVGDFVEVKLPGWTNTRWRSFMVLPKQVCYDIESPDTHNIIEQINHNIKITVSEKFITNGQRCIATSSKEFFTAKELIAIFAEN